MLKYSSEIEPAFSSIQALHIKTQKNIKGKMTKKGEGDREDKRREKIKYMCYMYLVTFNYIHAGRYIEAIEPGETLFTYMRKNTFLSFLSLKVRAWLYFDFETKVRILIVTCIKPKSINYIYII